MAKFTCREDVEADTNNFDLDLDSVIDTNSSEYDMIKFKDQSHGNIPMK